MKIENLNYKYKANKEYYNKIYDHLWYNKTNINIQKKLNKNMNLN